MNTLNTPKRPTLPVTVRESEAQDERSFEFGRSLEGDLSTIKDYGCVWDVACRAFKENPKKQQAWKEIAMKLKQDGKLAFLRLARHLIGFLILVYTLLHYCMLMPLTSEFSFYRE